MTSLLSSASAGFQTVGRFISFIAQKAGDLISSCVSLLPHICGKTAEARESPEPLTGSTREASKEPFGMSSVYARPGLDESSTPQKFGIVPSSMPNATAVIHQDVVQSLCIAEHIDFFHELGAVSIDYLKKTDLQVQIPPRGQVAISLKGKARNIQLICLRISRSVAPRRQV